MTRDEMDRLRALAEKAAPGPWRVKRHDDGMRVLTDEHSPWHICLVYTDIDVDIDGAAHAAFIAACSPDVVLSLLDAAERDAGAA